MLILALDTATRKLNGKVAMSIQIVAKYELLLAPNLKKSTPLLLIWSYFILCAIFRGPNIRAKSVLGFQLTTSRIRKWCFTTCANTSTIQHHKTPSSYIKSILINLNLRRFLKTEHNITVLWMMRCEPRISGVRSKRSTNCAKTTAQLICCLCELKTN